MAAPVAEASKNEDSRNELIVRIRREQKAMWDLGNRMPIEDWIEKNSSVLTDSDDQLVLILGEVEMRRAAGDKPELKEYQQRFPKLAELLELPFELMQDMASVNAAPLESTQKTLIRSKQQVSAKQPPKETAGMIIARKYKLLQQIGEGGMGSVWMADQMEPVKRRVAIKLIRGDREGSHNILSRFEAEQQAIALMDHPNIAKLLDAGQWSGDSSGAATPYFVMELVKGIPLNEFCDQHRLGIQERLQLFIQICSAVQHAHQKGIIHRDLKPSNILVEMHDEKPVPKVIDFGLAKATSGLSLTERTLFTGFGMIAGTPLYMAPEQARFNAIDIDTRADVYALGVLLYELLTGSTPLEREQFKLAALDEMLRLIRETDPPIPSKRLSSSESKPSVAANRHTEPAKLGRALRGELDWIVMKALNKERDRRYDSANSFAKDIERYLNHEPVNAGPPSITYRFRKFARRYRAQVAAAALVLTALVAGIIGTSYGLVEAQKQTAIAKEEKAKAIESAELERQARVREAERAEGERKAKVQVAAQLNQIVLINSTMFEIFSELDVRKIRANHEPIEVVLSKKLAAAGKKLDSRIIKDPLILAPLHTQLGVTLVNLGDADRAIDFFTSARKLWIEKLGPDSDGALLAANNLAAGFVTIGKYAQAAQILEETVKQYKAKNIMNENSINCAQTLAECYRLMGKLDLAIPLMEETLKAAKAQFGLSAPETLAYMNTQANIYWDAGRNDLALPLLEDLVKLSTGKLGADHPYTLLYSNNLAGQYKAAGKVDQAIKLYRQTLNLQMTKLGKNHPDTLGTMNNLAMSYHEAKSFEDAISLMEETLNLRTNTSGKNHPSTLMSKSNLALCYQSAGKLPQATSLNEETLKERKVVLGEDHPDTLASLINLALCYKEANRLTDAMPLFEQAALGIERKRFLSQDAGKNVQRIASLFEKNGQLEKAEALRRKWLTAVGEQSGIHSSNYAEELTGLGNNLVQQRKWIEAEKVLLESLSISKKPGTAKDLIPETLDRLVDLYTAWENKEKAEKYREEREKYPAKKQ